MVEEEVMLVVMAVVAVEAEALATPDLLVVQQLLVKVILEVLAACTVEADLVAVKLRLVVWAALLEHKAATV